MQLTKTKHGTDIVIILQGGIGVRILVIEDDLKLSEVIKKGLEASGFEIQIENTGMGGEEAAYVEHYDAILLDLNLPDKDGVDILHFLRQEGIQTPIIIVTARDEIGRAHV